VTTVSIHGNKTQKIVFTERIIPILSVIGTVAILAWVLWFSRYGIDFTDESFYLVWIANPFQYSLSATQFGFVYHPLYKLLDGNIAALRQTNILISFGLTWALVDIFFKTVFGTKAFERLSRLVMSSAIAVAAVAYPVFAGFWLPTPSYNSLALQALLIVASGLLLADATASRRAIFGWILIGVGGWLAFMAKPTTAAALALCVSLYLVATEKLIVRFVAISLAVTISLLTLSALIIDGSISSFVDRLKGGVEVGRILGAGHTLAEIFRLDNFFLDGHTKLLLGVSTAVIFLSVYCSQAKNKLTRFVGLVLSITSALLILAIITRIFRLPLAADGFQGLLLCAVPFAVILAGLAIYKFEGIFQTSRHHWALALVFLVFPYAYAFGSGDNYWSFGANAGIFWILASLVFMKKIALSPQCPALFLAVGFSVQSITVALVQAGMETPYRQPQPLHSNNYEITVGPSGSTLILPQSFGKYIAEAMDVAALSGFKKGTPVIDLTGRSPGILYAIGASNIGQAWTIGGYPGSEALAVAMLRKSACQELSIAWLLVEPEGPRAVSPTILSSFGANVVTDFEVVGKFMTAKGAGVAMTGCSASRTAKQ